MSAPGPQTVAKRMSSVRYLRISSEDVPEQQSHLYWTSLQLCIMHCVQLQHLHFYYTGDSLHFSAILVRLAELRAMQKLQSLRLRLDTDDPEHTIFKDVSRFIGLEGLGVHASRRPSKHPQTRLKHLKELEIDWLDTADETYACMALICPENLRRLHIGQFDRKEDVPIRSPDSFNTQIWQNLHYMSVQSQSPFIPVLFDERAAVRFPALREVHVQLAPNAQPKQLFKSLPACLTHLHIDEIRDSIQSLGIIALIEDARWSSGDLKSIELEFDVFDGGWVSVEPFVLDVLLVRAAEAMQAAATYNLVLDPSDLVAGILNVIADVNGRDSDYSESSDDAAAAADEEQ